MFQVVTAVCVFVLAFLTGYILPPHRRCQAVPVTVATQAKPPLDALPAERPAPDPVLKDPPTSIPSPNVSLPPSGSLTVILTQFLRPTLEELIHQIRRQTVPVTHIIVFQNGAHVNASRVLAAKPEYADILFVHNVNFNTGFFGRFTLPLLLTTEFVAIFDDDTIPGSQWLENCLRVVVQHNAICGANGRVVVPGKRQMMGVKMPHPNDVEVDFVGHCWVFRRSWVHHMWRVPPATLSTAEDIHFSATAFIYGGIKTMVPRMPKGPQGRKMWPSKGGGSSHVRSLDTDQHASWRRYQSSHQGLRGRVIAFWRRQGWKVLYIRSKGRVMKNTQTGGDFNLHSFHSY